MIQVPGTPTSAAWHRSERSEQRQRALAPPTASAEVRTMTAGVRGQSADKLRARTLVNQVFSL
jgi:hypothetical protein